jgi:hypothetical protein
MDILHLEGTADTPKIILDKANGIFEISGRSLPEDSVEFYRPVVEWIANYAKEPNATTSFCFKLEYFNTSSSKLILDVLSALEEIKGMKIDWYYQEDDEDMEEAGKEFAELVEIPFSYQNC